MPLSWCDNDDEGRWCRVARMQRFTVVNRTGNVVRVTTFDEGDPFLAGAHIATDNGHAERFAGPDASLITFVLRGLQREQALSA